MSEKRTLLILTLAVLAIISLPYLLGFQAGSQLSRFGGFLINPVDGHSYLAKMQQGVRGDWRFRLPYTAEPGEGAYVFLFYLGLGHLSRVMNLPVISVFHLARLVSAVWLIWVIHQMVRSLFKDPKAIWFGLILSLFGSGLGWLAALSGGFTSDFWVAEAYPFLAMYTNPHFTVGLGLMLYALLPDRRENLRSNLIAGLLLGLIQPFSVVIISLVKLSDAGIKVFRERSSFKEILEADWFWPRIGFCLAGGMVLIYQYWAILSDPVLSLWHQQNITPNPGVLDLLISLSPALILGGIGVRKAWKEDEGRMLVLWAGISLILVFIPWRLQRRFLTGIYFPLAGLSVFGVLALVQRTSIKFRHWVIATLFFAIPTNLIVLASGLQAIASRNPSIFLDRDLLQGLAWINSNSGQKDLVLADPEHGLTIPSLTGRRVVYGHPFETVQAEDEAAFLEEVFYGQHKADFYQRALKTRSFDYVMLDSSQAQDFNRWLVDNRDLVFQSNEIMIYSGQIE